MQSINEYIASIEKDKALFPEQLHKYYREKFIFYDSRDPNVLLNLARAAELRKEGLTPKEILTKLIPIELKIGTWYFCDYEEFGAGKVVEIFNSGNMFVKFNKRRLPTMCDSKSTIHDEKKRKIRIIA